MSIYITIGDKEEHPSTTQLSRDEGKAMQRRRIRPMEIVQHDEQRMLRADFLNETCDCIEQPKTRWLRL